ncbi:MAG: DUF418 domain-containing protein, partial [Cytophagales bacterium]|nr:DUF418 domain-containing protein [Cytophagales bacterium]
PQKYSKESQWVFFAAVGSAILINVLQRYLAQLPEGTIPKEGMANYYLGQWMDGYFSLFMVMIWVLLFVFVYKSSVGQRILGYLAPMGRMSLTIYFIQSILCTPIYYGYGWGWYATCTQLESLLLGIGLLVLQMIFAHWWMNKFAYGPLEWLWRSITYGSWVKLKK